MRKSRLGKDQSVKGELVRVESRSKEIQEAEIDRLVGEYEMIQRLKMKPGIKRRMILKQKEKTAK